MMQELKLPPPSSTTVLEDYGIAAPELYLEDKPTTQKKSVAIPMGSIVETSSTCSSATEDDTIYGSPAFRDVPTLVIQQQHRGHKFLGFGCDMRRAVVIFNSIALSFTFLEILTATVFYICYDEITNPENHASDWLSQAEDIVPKKLIGISIGISCASFVFFCLGIRGALRYEPCLVGASLLFHCAALVGGFLLWNLFGIILSGLFIYPHIVLLFEMRSDIMTVENYANERSTCCC